jgi:hypothetical protein
VRSPHQPGWQGGAEDMPARWRLGRNCQTRLGV